MKYFGYSKDVDNKNNYWFSNYANSKDDENQMDVL